MPSLAPDAAMPRVPRPVVVRLELSCLLCGEIAGLLEDRRIIRPRSPGSIRYDGRRLRCGRCGSCLIPGEEDRTPLAVVARSSPPNPMGPPPGSRGQQARAPLATRTAPMP